MTQAGGAAPSGEVTTHCYRHPQREALVRCTRCDRPICPDCMRPASVGFHCPDDARAGARSIRAPRTAVGARITDAPPVVTGVLVALNVIVYLITGLEARGTLANPTNSRLFFDWQLSPYAIHTEHEYYRLLTSAFLHLSPLHIGANMLALIVIGPSVERLLGWWRYLAVYVIAALGSGAAVYAFGSQIGYTAGASGAIFGLFGVALLLARKLGLDLQWLIGVIVLNFVVTFAVPNISKLGHLGGFVTGLLAALALDGLPRMRERVPPRLQVAGLGAITVVLLLVVVIRTLTW